MTTSTADTQAIVAGGGTTTTPVKVTLNTATREVSIQFKVVTTRAASPTVSPGLVKQFNLYFGFSADDLTLSTAAVNLRGNVQTLTMFKNFDIDVQRIQKNSNVRGQYLFIWMETPASSDAYSVVAYVTEIGS